MYRIYGVKINGDEEKFRFEYVDRKEAEKKAQELRNVISGVRFNVSNKVKYRNIIVKGEEV